MAEPGRPAMTEQVRSQHLAVEMPNGQVARASVGVWIYAMLQTMPPALQAEVARLAEEFERERQRNLVTAWDPFQGRLAQVERNALNPYHPGDRRDHR